MKFLIEVELGSDGMVDRVRVVSGGRVKGRKVRRPLALEGAKDSEEVKLVREFVAHYGQQEASRLLGVTRAALYQWTYRGRVPEKHLDAINRINDENYIESRG